MVLMISVMWTLDEEKWPIKFWVSNILMKKLNGLSKVACARVRSGWRIRKCDSVSKKVIRANEM